ncbi:protein SPIRAL1-like 3 [Rutidosis leptorrhynchoides]|uniref:protein SPIRAL1-like 3 n=1 Tax=Rutidosis leptorrhynchoides TaxID=125765 RepID=UPI003A993237
MGRGVSCGGGQSSLGYLFGADTGDNTQTPPENMSGGEETDVNVQPPPKNPSDDATTETETDEPSQKPASERLSIINQNPCAEGHDSTTNNYHRADGQNCGNFITNRPSTKVHAAPGGSSSLGYLFSDDNNK